MSELCVMVGPSKPEYLRECFPSSVELTAGDTRMMWNKDNPDEVEAARLAYNKLVSKGYVAFRTDSKGDRSSRLSEFDPAAERIIMVPKIQGGL
jgi:hypothetical protein